MIAEYRVQLDLFSGPLDLLLYLVRRDELDIQDIPIARIADQYLDYVHVLEQLDPNAAGDFLVMASTLIEMKSRALLPTPPLDGENEEEDARVALVRQLLEYKRFKDAARALGSAADERAQRYVRKPADLPEELRGVELEEVEVWDLLSAFTRLMTAIGQGPGLHEIQNLDRPIETYASSILERLEVQGPITLQAMFADCAGRAEIVALFLALLELIRKRRVRAEQAGTFGPIYLFELEEVEDETPDPVIPLPHPHYAPKESVAADAEDADDAVDPENGVFAEVADERAEASSGPRLAAERGSASGALSPPDEPPDSLELIERELDKETGDDGAPGNDDTPGDDHPPAGPAPAVA